MASAWKKAFKHTGNKARREAEDGGLETVGEVRTASDDLLLSFQNLGYGSVHHLRETLGLKGEDKMTIPILAMGYPGGVHD